MLPNFASIMPQCVGVWAEELGCEVFYETYSGREDIRRSLPDDLDLVFLSCFSRASFLAYALSAELRAAGVVTVLGGPPRALVRRACARVLRLRLPADRQGDDPVDSPGLFAPRDAAWSSTRSSQPASLPGVRRARASSTRISPRTSRGAVLPHDPDDRQPGMPVQLQLLRRRSCPLPDAPVRAARRGPEVRPRALRRKTRASSGTIRTSVCDSRSTWGSSRSRARD